MGAERERVENALRSALARGDRDLAAALAAKWREREAAAATAALPLPQRLAQQGAAQLEAGREFFSAPSLPQFPAADPSLRRDTDSSGFMGDAVRSIFSGGGRRTEADIGAGAPPETRQRILEKGGAATQAITETAALGAALVGMPGAVRTVRGAPHAEAIKPAARDTQAVIRGMKDRAKELEQQFRASKGLKESKGFKSPEATELWKRASGLEKIEQIVKAARGNAATIRSQLRLMSNRPKEWARFTPEQQAKLLEIVEGRNVGTALQELGLVRTTLREIPRRVGRVLDRRATGKQVDRVMRDLEG